MLGLYLNLLLLAIAAFELAFGIFFRVREKEKSYARTFIPFFTLFAVMVCGGYSMMGFSPDDGPKAFIPRFIGFSGIDALMLTELSFLLFDINIKKIVKYIVIGICSLFSLFDLIIYGNENVCTFEMRDDCYTVFKIADKEAYLFHYAFLIVTSILLFVLFYFWYKSKTIKREKRFVNRIIMANCIVNLAILIDVAGSSFSEKYPAFFSCISSAFYYLIWMVAIHRKLSFSMTLENVSKGIFDTIQVPILIFSDDGKVSLYNPYAQKTLFITKTDSLYLRDLFSLSDVEELRLLAKTKRGENYQMKTTVKANGKSCLVKCSVEKDHSGEFFCVIGTVLDLEQENSGK